jgi:histidyl-tRNA synthetase
LKCEEEKLFKLIENNDELRNLLNKIQLFYDTLEAFDEEIEKDPNLSYVIDYYMSNEYGLYKKPSSIIERFIEWLNKELI